MSKCIFALGKKDKKLLIPLLYLLCYIFINIFDKEADEDLPTTYITNFAMSISEIMFVFIGLVVKYAFKIKPSQKSEKQNFIKDFGILFFITGFYKLNDIMPYALEKLQDEEAQDNSRELLVNDALELVIITFVTIFTLKYKYYIHHVISIVLICVICIALDFLLINFIRTDIYTIITSVVLVIADSFLYSYFKYLIEFKYYFFLDILYIYGIFCLFWNSLSLALVVMSHKINGTNHIFFQFYAYYMKKGLVKTIIRFFLGFVVTGFIIDILEFMILDKLTPNYIIIGFEIGKIPSNIIEFIEDEVSEKHYKNLKVLVLVVLVILSILQIASLLLYLEIFELNFCNLNENTKKNIEERERLLPTDKYYSIITDNIQGDKISDIEDDNDSEIDMDGYKVSHTHNRNTVELTDGRDSSTIN